MTSPLVLNLVVTSVTDAGLANLKGLTNLSASTSSGTSVTDAGLAHLKGLTNLSKLVLADTRVTDAGLANLKGLTEPVGARPGRYQRHRRRRHLRLRFPRNSVCDARRSPTRV